jgi:ribonucleoside-diphosphate reductase alpha chain
LVHTKASQYENGKKVEVGETAVCNLGSVNLTRHITDDGDLDWDKLADTIQTSMRMLDNVIDINFYPTEEAQNSNMKHRFVGLGSMGWQDFFHAKGIDYDSDEAVEWSDKIYEFISYHAIKASSELAKEREAYPSFDGSLWSQDIFPIDTYRQLMEYRGDNAQIIGDTKETMDWSSVREHVAEHGMRNALTMAIAPTATTGFIAGSSQSTEPNFSVLYVYSTLSGEFTLINRYFVEDMKKLGLWDEDMVQLVKYVDGNLSLLDDEVMPPEIKHKYRTAFELDQEKIIENAAARQKWIDQGASLNLYNDKTSLKFLNDIYMKAWQTGLKTTYYLRNQAASKVEKSTVDEASIQKIIENKKEQVESLNHIDVTDIACVGCE